MNMDGADAIGYGILANLATKILSFSKNGIQNTRLYVKLSSYLRTKKVIQIEANLHELLIETNILYFNKMYPDYNYRIVKEFFLSNTIAEALHNRLFNFQAIDYDQLAIKLKLEIDSDWILKKILRNEKVNIENIIQNYIITFDICVSQFCGLNQILLLSEINSVKAVVSELKEKQHGVLESVVDKIDNINNLMENMIDFKICDKVSKPGVDITGIIVDNDLDWIELLSEPFREFGFKYRTGSNYIEGLTLINELKPDIAIFDVQLKDPVDIWESEGMRLLKDIKLLVPKSSVIMVSAYSFLHPEQISESFREHHTLDFFVKHPFDAKRYREQIISCYAR